MWTMDNTDGFTEFELNTINQARDQIIQAVVDPSMDDDDLYQISRAIDDAINNKWQHGISADALAAAVIRKFRPAEAEDAA